MFASPAFYPQQPFNFSPQALNPMQCITSYINKLQNVVLNQQNMINSLKIKAELQEKDIYNQLSKLQHIRTKLQDNSHNLILKNHNSSISDLSSETADESVYEAPEISIGHTSPKIIRRNGFKASNETKTKVTKVTNKSSPSSQNSNDSDDQSKTISRAKHLWVNYGRRILEFAMNETRGAVQTRIKQLTGKLSSKRDFEEVFQVTSSTSAEDKEFKTLLGGLAIDFVKNRATNTFENSKYKQQMILQRHNVAAWIEGLINP